MNKNIYTFLSILFISFGLMAENPNSHLSILNDNPQVEKSKPIDEEDPYFILSGEADKAIADGDYPTAVLRLREALSIDPSNPSNALLLSNLGMAYANLDQDSLALDAYDKALAIAPSMSAILNNRALLLLKLGKDREAYDDFSKVIDRDSLNISARYYRGIMSLYGGDMQGAEKDFDILAVRDPESYNTIAAQAILYSLTGREAKAVPYLRKLIEIDPSGEFYAMLAGCLLQLREYTEASAVIADGLKACGDDPELYYYRAWLRRDTFRHDEAKEDARKAVQLGADPRKVAQLFQK